MANVDDTNVLSRTNTVIQGYVKSEAVQLLRIGGASTARGMEALKKLNQKFIHMNVSPGGCADLLADHDPALSPGAVRQIMVYGIGYLSGSSL